MIKHICSLFLILALSVSLYASEYNFYNINSDLGLSQNNVKSIYQDSKGFLWFGTKNKLNRYDGISVKIFDCYDHQLQKGNNNIGVIFEGSDGKLWLGTDKGVYIFDPVYEKFSFLNLASSEGVVINDWISSIERDANQNIWIVAPNQGVFRYEEAKKKISMYTVVDKLQPSISNPQCAVLDKNNNVWIGTNGSGLYKYNREQDSFVQYIGNKDTSISLNISLKGKNIYSIESYQNSLFVAIHEEKLLSFDIEKEIFTELIHQEPTPNFKIIRHLSVLNKNELWVGTQFGIYIISLETSQVRHITEDLFEKTSLSDNLIETIFQDKEGNIWIGTGSSGIDYLPKSGIDFHIYSPSFRPGSLLSKRVRDLVEDNNNNIWVGTEDVGAFKLNPNTSEFVKIPNLQYNRILSLMKNQDEVWIGYFKNGLDIISTSNNSLQKPAYHSPMSMGLNEESVYALCKDRKGNVWLGNAWGVFLAQSGSMKFERQTQFGLCYTYDIIEDQDGYIWIATMGKGVFKYDPQADDTVHFVTGEKENTLSSNSVSSITEDHIGQIWFSTDRGGICVYNKDSKDFKRYSKKEGLPDDVAYKIVEDKLDNLWFGTNKGLVKLNPKDESLSVFTTDNGLPSNQFNYKSGLMTQKGDLFFGTSNGLIRFNPHNIVVNTYVPPVYITKLSIFNDEVHVNDGSILEQSLIHTDRLELPYNKTNITLGFVSLSYTSPRSNKFSYKMENVDTDWITASQTQTASYSNLAPGKYIFKVRGSNNDGLWNQGETQLEIIVTPPWWKSTLASILYILIAILLIYLIVRFSANKYATKIKQKQELYRIKKEKELYEDKVNFFTNVAHEVRTPLTLIHAPLESLLDMNIDNKLVREYLDIIDHNTQNLLSLVNQLLDFNKVTNNKVYVNWQKVDIIDLVNQVVFLFKGQTEKINKSIKVHTPEDMDSLLANVDIKEFTKIINNLISNALKYSDQLVELYIDKNDDVFRIHVKNDGKLIPKEYQEKIFEPFFRIKDSNRDIIGSGIGLSLAMSLTNAHKGTLQYTTSDHANNFILTIPLENDHDAIEQPKIEDSDNQLDEDDGKIDSNVEKIRLLLVDDNKEIIEFLEKRLRATYSVLTAFDGQEALEILFREKVDIVISDIMMPQMDGFELCSKIKNEEQLSHIIVLLLTAKSDLASKIKGLEIGADAYLEKPFSVKYLTTLINAQIANKIRDSHTFIKKPIAYSKQINMNKADEDFIDKLNDIVQENISSSDFNVTLLAEALNVSRSGLHRKTTEALNLSPIEYIRLCRLQKAAELISELKYRINEIAYMVGINTPSYFIKIFQAHYGMTPKEYEEHIKDNIP